MHAELAKLVPSDMNSNPASRKILSLPIGKKQWRSGASSPLRWLSNWFVSSTRRITISMITFLTGNLKLCVSSHQVKMYMRLHRNFHSVFTPFTPIVPGRSEEHTSELQSRGDLVCRLLLEKQN